MCFVCCNNPALDDQSVNLEIQKMTIAICTFGHKKPKPFMSMHFQQFLNNFNDAIYFPSHKRLQYLFRLLSPRTPSTKCVVQRTMTALYTEIFFSVSFMAAPSTFHTENSNQASGVSHGCAREHVANEPHCPSLVAERACDFDVTLMTCTIDWSSNVSNHSCQDFQGSPKEVESVLHRSWVMHLQKAASMLLQRKGGH